MFVKQTRRYWGNIVEQVHGRLLGPDPDGDYARCARAVFNGTYTCAEFVPCDRADSVVSDQPEQH